MNRIKLKTPDEVKKIRRASQIVAKCLKFVSSLMVEGITTKEIDQEIEAFILREGGKPAFKGYGNPLNPFPFASCISIDNVVVHGIPSDQKLLRGMIVGIDVGVEVDGFFGDAAYTFAVGKISPDKQKLLDVTELALNEAIKQIKPNQSRLSDIGATVQSIVEQNGFSVVRDLVGHGIGKSLHEEPQVPNYGNYGFGPILQTGMTLAIEPMINMGTYEVKTLADGWTVVTIDGKPSAHFEHTVYIGKDCVEILTELDG
ncbi:MAG: type I methionyl aminopeptidase [bacterium]|nr:type I methionyl aminopeptidase [bacterium]